MCRPLHSLFHDMFERSAMFKLRLRWSFLVFCDDLHLELNFGVRIDNSQQPDESV